MAPLMAPRRLVMAALMRGPATRHRTTNRNVTASQKSWLGKVSVLNGGKPAASCLAGTPVVAVVAAGSAILEREQDQERDDQAEQTGGFAKRKAQQEVGGLGGGSARIAQGARQVGAEHIADADTGADKRDTGQARADHLS